MMSEISINKEEKATEMFHTGKRGKSSSGQSKKLRKGNLYKAPTAEEISDLKEAEMMFHSSLFRLQTNELISEVRMKSTQKSSLKSWLENLKKFLQEIPASEEYEINDQSWVGKGVKVPITMKPKSQRGLFQFLPPSEVSEVGSYLLDTVCEKNPVVDIALQVPKQCWQKMDFLNYIYHRKRALYLTYIAKHLKGHELIENMEFAFQDGCHPRPALLLSPAGNLVDNITVRLLPYPEEGSFKLPRFIPLRNNIRKSWYHNQDSTDEDAGVPTPFYNSTVLQDILLPSLSSFLEKNITSQSVRDGIIMLKVWCIQREMYEGNGSLNGFLISMLVSYLLVKQKINHLMSSYQVFRIALLWLSREDWSVQGTTLCPNKVEFSSLEDHRQHSEVIFIDPSGYCNLCYFLHEEDILRVKHEAEIAIKVLDSASSDSFASLFLNKIRFCRKFEGFITLQDGTKWKSYCDKLNATDAVMDRGRDYASCLIPRLSKILRKGLGNRILYIGCKKDQVNNWKVGKRIPPLKSRQLIFGLLYDQEFAFSNLDKGPTADDAESREFRSFWGDKSELRRFKDGSIHEAVFWPGETIEDKRHVASSIISYILHRHAGIENEDILFSGNDIDDTLHLPKQLHMDNFPPYGTGEELFMTMHQSFNFLATQLRRLDELPLAMSSIQGISSAFRFSEVFPPMPRHHFFNKSLSTKNGSFSLPEDNLKTPAWVKPLKVVIHFEGSGKWPNEYDALLRIKAALHLKIAELLTSRFNLCTRPTASFVDVLKDGYVFRLEVACHKEITLLKQTKAPDGMVKVRDTSESEKLEYHTEILPKLNSILHGIHQQHNTFGTACRLAKRWISSQLLQGHISDITVELIMAHVYISPEPFTCPSSPQLAFQRFLSILCNHDWGTNSLVVNFNHDLKQAELADIAATISSQRAHLPAMIIVTPLDKSGCMFTKDVPSLLILKRLITLSKASLEILEKQLFSSDTVDFKQIFRPPLNPYDVLIHLNLKKIPKAHLAVDTLDFASFPSYKKYYKRSDEIMPIVGYDPVESYLNLLKESYGEFALFFYDAYGGDIIAVVWRPDAFKAKPFKVSNINGRFISGMNADGSVNIVPNVEALLEGFEVLGKGLVNDITNQTDKWSIC